MERFFIWCAGSDQQLLKNCPKRERIKHMGFGTLVLIPALLAVISMSFALSTLEPLHELPWVYVSGGFLWGLIIFAFDRFIVSTHRKKKTDKAELQNPTFFLRLGFALLLGIVISHPLVMLYFDGSIQDQIAANEKEQKQFIASDYNQQIAALTSQISWYDSLYLSKLNERNAQAAVVAKEIDGEVLENAKGEKVTTGLYGEGPAAKQKIKQLNQLQSDLNYLEKEREIKSKELGLKIRQVDSKQDSAIAAFAISTDYLQRELALEQLKEENSIVGITQWLLICLFVLVDILPLIFKTFAPYGLYEKIATDDGELVHGIENKIREAYLASLYEKASKES